MLGSERADVYGRLERLPGVSAPPACPPAQVCNGTQNRCAGTLCQAPVITAAASPVGPATEPTSCRRPVDASALPSGEVQHFGTKTVGDIVSFTVPAGTG